MLRHGGRRLLLGAAILIAVHLALRAGLCWAMRQPPNTRHGSVPMSMMMVLPFEKPRRTLHLAAAACPAAGLADSCLYRAGSYSSSPVIP